MKLMDKISVVIGGLVFLSLFIVGCIGIYDIITQKGYTHPSLVALGLIISVVVLVVVKGISDFMDFSIDWFKNR